jgi:pimeloyl-ACP methyl ester carboxylesterase
MTDATTPDHTVTLPDGRTVAVDEHGTPDGPVVTFLHSSPGSRLYDPDPVATTGAGIRLLTLDRAGYGASSPAPEGPAPTIAERADDVAAALAALGVTSTAVVGWSHGGHVALALGARHPDLARSMALIGTPAPDGDVPWVAEGHRSLLQAMRSDPDAARATLRAALAPLAAGPDALLSDFVVGEADTATYAADEERLRAYLAGAVTQGAEGLAADIVAMHVAPWGFDPRAVGAPVELFWGEEDIEVPPTHGDYWEARLADSRQHRVPGMGHLVQPGVWKDVLGALR